MCVIQFCKDKIKYFLTAKGVRIQNRINGFSSPVIPNFLVSRHSQLDWESILSNARQLSANLSKPRIAVNFQ